MCDEHYVEDLARYVNRSRLTRRKFGAMSAGVGLSMLLPPVANAQDVTERDVEIETPDGTADAYFVHPSTGAHAGTPWNSPAPRQARWWPWDRAPGTPTPTSSPAGSRHGRSRWP